MQQGSPAPDPIHFTHPRALGVPLQVSGVSRKCGQWLAAIPSAIRANEGDHKAQAAQPKSLNTSP